MKNIGFYFHGATPSKEAAEVASQDGVRGRNALHFVPGELEDFDSVLIESGPNAEAIKKAYEDRKVKATLWVPGKADEKKAEAKKESKADEKKAEFDPDAKRTTPEPKVQG